MVVRGVTMRTQARWVGSVKIDGDAEAAGEDCEAGDVVLMLVGDEDGVEGGGVFVRRWPCA